MNKIAIKTFGKKQTSREGANLFMVNVIEGLIETLNKDFSESSNFDCWENIVAQKIDFFKSFGCLTS